MRLIDADELLKGKQDHEMISTHVIWNAPTINSCEDAISREWLLEHFGLSEKTRKYGGDHSGYDTRMLYEIQDAIENAPSVAPSRPKGMDELVEGFAKALTYEDVITAEAEGYAQGFKDGMESKSSEEWTPWKDGLPCCSEEVLVTDGTFVWIDELQSDGDMYWWDCQNVEPETTAWMYLPEPYKESE